MARVYTSSVIGAPASKVWDRVRDFNGLPRWHPSIRESRIENGEPSDKVLDKLRDIGAYVQG